MILKLRLNKDHIESAKRELKDAGVEISEDTEFILTEENYHDERLVCRDGSERVILPFADINHIESFGHDVFIFTKEWEKYKTDQRLYQLEAILPIESFIRISNSVIIHRKSIRKIVPTLSSKYLLTLENGAKVDVTRTYYHKFKEFYGI